MKRFLFLIFFLGYGLFSLLATIRFTNEISSYFINQGASILLLLTNTIAWGCFNYVFSSCQNLCFPGDSDSNP